MGPAAVLNVFVNAQTGTASGKMTKFNSQMKAAEAQANRSTAAAGKFAKAAKLVGIAVGVGAAYGLYKGITAGATFEKQIDELGAVTDATRRDMAKFEKQALALGEATQYTANEVAKAQTELAKGGLSAKQINGGALKASLSLAAAGSLELATAAETTVNAMKLFGLRGEDTGQIADMLATAANRTTADVSDFAMALKQGGSVAKLAGLSFNNTVTVLEALAEAGIKNSDAGTSMKTSLIQLLKPSEKQAKLTKALGIDWIKQNGTIKTAAGLSEEIRRATDGMTKSERAKTLATLAGTDGVRTLNALYDAGPKKLRNLEEANKKQGTAQEIARKKMDNLTGDTEQLTGALETLGIKLYKKLAPALRSATQWLTNMVIAIPVAIEWFQKHEDAALALATAIGSLAAGLVAYKASLAITGAVNALRDAMIGLNIAMIANPVGAVIAGIAALGVASFVAYQKIKPFHEAVDETFDSLAPVAEKVKAFAEQLNRIGDTQVGFVNLKEAVLAAVSPLAFLLLHFEDVKAVALTVAGAMVTAWTAVVSAFTATVSAVVSAGEWIGRAASNVAGFVTALLPVKVALLAIKVALAPLILGISLFTQHVLPPLMKILGGVAGAIVAILIPAITMLAQDVGAVLSYAIKVGSVALAGILRLIGDLGDIVGQVVGLVSNLLRGKWGAAWENAKQLFAAVWKFITDYFKSGWRLITTVFSSGVKTIKTILGNGLHALIDIAERIADPVKTAFEGIWDGITGVFETGVAAITGLINGILNVINPLLDAVGIGKIELIGGSSSTNKHSGKKGNRSGNTVAPENKQRGGVTGLAAMVPGASTGDRHTLALNGVPVARVESREGIFVGNRNLMGALQKANDAVPRFQTGGMLPGFSIGGDIWGAVKDIAGYTPPGLAFKAANAAVNTAGDLSKGADYFINGLPGMKGAGLFGDIGNALVGKVKDWIGGLPSSIFGGGSGGVDLSGISGSVASQAAQIAKRARGPRVANLALFEALWAESSMGAAAPGNVLEALEPYTKIRPAAQEISGFLTGVPTWTGTAAIPTARANPGMPAHAIAQLVQKSGVGEGNEGRANYLQQKGRALATMAKFGLAEGGPVGRVKGNPFDANAMRATATMAPLMAKAGGGGFLPRSIERIKAKASQIAKNFTGYVWGGGHSEGNNVTANELDCSGAIAKLMQESGFNFPVAVSSDYASRFNPGVGDLFTIWSNAGHTFANIEGKDWGTNTANGLGYATHTHSGFTPVHPLLAGGDKSSTEHTYKEDVPAVYRGCKTGSLSFGSVPKSLDGINKETGKRRNELKRYRAAADYATGKKRPGIAQALQQNITKLEARIRELERARAHARREAAKRKITAKLGKQLGMLTGFDKLIGAKERGFNKGQQDVEQLVDLEPIAPELAENLSNAQRQAAEGEHIANVIRYVWMKEQPAYQDLLARAGDWRNTILAAEHKAAGPWQTSKTLGGMEGNWEDRIFSTGHQIKQIEAFSEKAKGDLTGWKKKHPGKKALPDWLRDEVAKMHEGDAKLPILRFTERELRKVLGEGQGEFYPGKSRISSNPTPPYPGSGALEGALENVQGIHWPGQHEMLANLPANRVALRFGGIIWDVQEQIEGLGLKIRDAGGGAGGGGGGGGDEGESESAAYWKEQTRLANQRNLVFERQNPIVNAYIAKNFAGMFAKGGGIAAGKWGIAGEAGPEIVQGPARVYSAAESAAMGTGSMAVNVEVHNYGDRTEVLVNGMKQVAADVFDHKARQQGKASKLRNPRAGKGV